MKEKLLGLDILVEQRMNCSNCGILLAEVVVMETNEKRKERGLKPLNSSFKVNNCMKCGGGSFIHGPFAGTTSVGTFRDNLLLDTENTTLLEDGTILTVLSLKQR